MPSLGDIQGCISELKRRGKPILAFFIGKQKASPDEYMRQIQIFLQKEFSSFSLMARNMVPLAQMPDPCFVIEDEQDISCLSGIDFIFTTDSGTCNYPQDAVVLAFVHSFSAYVRPTPRFTHRYQQEYFDAVFDTNMRSVTDRELIRRSNEYRLNPADIRRPSKTFYYIPVGDARVESVRRTVEKRHLPVDSLLYAPASPVWAHGNAGDKRMHIMPDYARRVVGDLLESFPDYRVIFRPQANSWEHPYTIDLIKTFSGHARFFVSRIIDHADEFCRSAVLVTDYSNIGETFALSCLRPELRLRYGIRSVRRSRTGLLCPVDTDIVPLVREILENHLGWAEHIRSSYNDYILPPEETFPRIRQVLLDFLAERRPKHWVALARDNSLPPWTELDYLRHVFLEDTFDPVPIRRFLAHFPHDPTALCLHLLFSREATPDFYIKENVTRITRHMPVSLSETTPYGLVPKSLYRALFALGMKKAMEKGNTAYAEAITGIKVRLFGSEGEMA